MKIDFGPLATAADRRRIEQLVAAAEAGDTSAARAVGHACRLGESGLRQSLSAAFIWYARSALAGDAAGQCNLAVCYEVGAGCRIDHELSVAWFRQSAAQGHDVAAYNLGVCYEQGRGVVADPAEALAWHCLAVRRGFLPAIEKVAWLTGAIPPGVRFEEVPGEGRLVRVEGPGGVGEPVPDGPVDEIPPGFFEDVTEQCLGTSFVVGDSTR
ncbi:MAG: sel1 repeat family protein [Gammaproteobacteria bacterium]|nr:sel1 repeat family protein [Gammaproteobacteria bacterium]